MPISVAVPLPASMPGLTPEEAEKHKKAFAEQGYFIHRGAVSREKLDVLRARIAEEFDRARSNGQLFSGGGLLSGHLNCFPGAESRFVHERLREIGLIDLIRELHPASVRAPNVGLNFNLPGSVKQHCHADRPFTQEFMIANIAVVDTELVNGAIEVCPGTHRKFYPFWRFALESPRAVRLPMQQGDVLVRSSNLWHRGMPNLSTVARPMMALTWEDGGSLQEDPFAAEGGRITFRPNWYRPNLLGRLRERTFIAVPISYSAYRFTRSLVGNKGYDH